MKTILLKANLMMTPKEVNISVIIMITGIQMEINSLYSLKMVKKNMNTSLVMMKLINL